MLFNVEYDKGDVIEGYLIPDGFSDEPRIVVTRDDGTKIALPCDQPRPASVQSGRHATGLVGFRLDEGNIFNLELQTRLSIHDAKSGMLIYRRPPIAVPVPMKLLRLEMSIIPMFKFDDYCGHHFQYAISSAERFGHETTMQAFHLNAVSSIYVSGRLLLRNYEDFLDRGFKVIADVPDPYYEMAARLFILKRLTAGPITFIGERDRIFLASAAAHFANVDLEDTKAIGRALKKIPDKARHVLRSPFTRQLVCTFPEQQVSRRDVAAAVSLLSRFSVVGYGTDNTHFQDATAELIGIDAKAIPATSRHSVLMDLAKRLRSLPAAEAILEEDLIFDHYVRQAVVPCLN